MLVIDYLEIKLYKMVIPIMQCLLSTRKIFTFYDMAPDAKVDTVDRVD